jgi:hypothetical protein
MSRYVVLAVNDGVLYEPVFLETNSFQALRNVKIDFLNRDGFNVEKTFQEHHDAGEHDDVAILEEILLDSNWSFKVVTVPDDPRWERVNLQPLIKQSIDYLNMLKDVLLITLKLTDAATANRLTVELIHLINSLQSYL